MSKNKKSIFLEEATALLESFEGQKLDLEEKCTAAQDLAALIIQESARSQTLEEKKEQKTLWKMMLDLRGKAFTTSVVDQIFRSSSHKRSADQINFLIDQLGSPRFLGLFDRLKLLLFRKFSAMLPVFFIPLFRRELKKQTKKVILPAEKKPLLDHCRKRALQGVQLNINYLGEKVTGKEIEIKRLDHYLQFLSYPQINYVSTKISSIFSQINPLAFEKTVEEIQKRLRKLYQAAIENSYLDKDGVTKAKFINLDMEEYQELHLTISAFKNTLDEDPFKKFYAGIVLQAYLPDSYEILKDLITWAKKRVDEGGAPIKIRLVKGANLAHEQVESSAKNWPQPPYTSKMEVDANYKRMLLYALRPENAPYAHIGVASHNIFEIAFALITRNENKVEEFVSFEMLEGICDQSRRVVQKLAGNMILYCPVTKNEDYQHAVSYLTRRFDENSGKDNFLRHSFSISPNSREWESQALLFSQSIELIDKVSLKPRRGQNRNQIETKEETFLFDEEPDTDFSLRQNQDWANAVLNEWKNLQIAPIPVVVDGKEHSTPDKKTGYDPSKNSPLYQFSIADETLADKAITAAKNAQKSWEKTSFQDKKNLFRNIAQEFRNSRGLLLGSMIASTGKTFYEADPEASEAIDFIEYYLKQYEKILSYEDLFYEAKGCIVVTPPWNFPLAIPTGGIAAALLTGNTVIFKPAPEAVLVGFELAKLFWKAGIPKDVLQFVPCEDEVGGSKLIADPRVDGVILTGSSETAKHFMKLHPDLHLLAETGGKNTMIITAMADRDLAINALIRSAFGHAGQKCSATSIAILEKEVYDDKKFLKQLKDAAACLKVGESWDKETVIGPLIKKPTNPLLQGLTTLEKKQKYLLKPQCDPNNPNIWSPGIILGVRPGSFLHQTELFGPVLGLIRAEDFDEALRIANNSKYGLTAGICSLDQRELAEWQEKIEVGNLYINRTTTGALVKRQPFGGCKDSSFGFGLKAGGPNYLRSLVNIQQSKLPKEKHPLGDEVNFLTSLLNQVDLTAEELGMWYASISNYAYWWKKMTRQRDVTKLVGQDNLFHYVPHKRMVLRIDENSQALDTLRILAAALTCGCPLEISSSVEKTNEVMWKELSLYLKHTEEDDLGFEKRIKQGMFKRIRLTSKASPSLITAAAKQATSIIDDPVLINGRAELLWYLREVSISIDYHRHGNLGLREDELRRPIL